MVELVPRKNPNLLLYAISGEIKKCKFYIKFDNFGIFCSKSICSGHLLVSRNYPDLPFDEISGKIKWNKKLMKKKMQILKNLS